MLKEIDWDLFNAEDTTIHQLQVVCLIVQTEGSLVHPTDFHNMINRARSSQDLKKAYIGQCRGY